MLAAAFGGMALMLEIMRSVSLSNILFVHVCVMPISNSGSACIVPLGETVERSACTPTKAMNSSSVPQTPMFASLYAYVKV